MKKFGILLFAFLGIVSCSDDDDANVDPPFEGETKKYDVSAVGESGVSGTAIFDENEDGSVTITLDLDGTTAGVMHPAHIHYNSAAEGGEIALSLDPVDGDTGISETTVDMLDDDQTEISFEDLLEFDGYINVHASADDLETLVAQTDIGGNELTGESKSYDLAEVDIEGVSGTATFHERKNGETLVELDLEGTTEGNTHPAHIHMGSVADAPGDIAITLTSVDGASGMSLTNVAMTDGTEEEDGTAVSYEDLIEYNGYINVHASADDLATLAAQGNIGANTIW
ncbi:CHRD domain-containing protein [Zunongwangia pacifica]|uniref:Superoxide dismutase family protein n=1 Tax=Zunongwangia pacifica TaxID=2911062 RepID=A0A9X2CPA8_9FLAO|nr:CHRD domain-containing protein [Zunongwangia pacifica]MCL6217863.1 superoxide dismutase family protein [Zunongwangia pacifica]